MSNFWHELGPWFYAIFVSVATFLIPVKELMLCVGFLVLMDMAFGIARAKKQALPIESQKMKRTLAKTLLYEGVILSSFVLDVIVGADIIAKVVAGTVAIVELKSISENFKIITGIDIWQSIIDKMQGKYSQKDPSSEDKKE